MFSRVVRHSGVSFLEQGDLQALYSSGSKSGDADYHVHTPSQSPRKVLLNISLRKQVDSHFPWTRSGHLSGYCVWRMTVSHGSIVGLTNATLRGQCS